MVLHLVFFVILVCSFAVADNPGSAEQEVETNQENLLNTFLLKKHIDRDDSKGMKELGCFLYKDSQTTNMGFLSYFNVIMNCTKDELLPNGVTLVLCDECNIPEQFVKPKKMKKYEFKASAHRYLIAFRNKENHETIPLQLPIACYCDVTKKKRKRKDRKGRNKAKRN